MRQFRITALIFLSFFISACQLLKPAASNQPDSTRLQGTITELNGKWLFQPCATQDSYILEPSLALNEELHNLSSDSGSPLFADLAGTFDNNQQRFTPQQRYRLLFEGHACDDPDFARLQLRASGNEPFWSILLSSQGLLLNQIDQASVALPYIEEQLADGRLIISSQANHQNLQLWLSPNTCIDSMSGAVHHLTARLQLDQQTHHGCAAFGARRD